MTRYTATDLRNLVNETPEDRLVDSLQSALQSAALDGNTTYELEFTVGKYNVPTLISILTGLALTVSSATVSSNRTRLHISW